MRVFFDTRQETVFYRHKNGILSFYIYTELFGLTKVVGTHSKYRKWKMDHFPVQIIYIDQSYRKEKENRRA